MAKTENGQPFNGAQGKWYTRLADRAIGFAWSDLCLFYTVLPVYYLGPEAFNWDWELGEPCDARQMAGRIEAEVTTVRPVLGHDGVIISVTRYGPEPKEPPAEAEWDPYAGREERGHEALFLTLRDWPGATRRAQEMLERHAPTTDTPLTAIQMLPEGTMFTAELRRALVTCGRAKRQRMAMQAATWLHQRGSARRLLVRLPMRCLSGEYERYLALLERQETEAAAQAQNTRRGSQ